MDSKRVNESWGLLVNASPGYVSIYYLLILWIEYVSYTSAVAPRTLISFLYENG